MTEVLYGPQDISPAAWARVNDDESLTTDGERFAAWCDLVSEMQDYMALVAKVDELTKKYTYAINEVRYSSHHEVKYEKERGITTRYAPRFFKLGMDPYQVASAMGHTLAELIAALFPEWDAPLVLLSYDSLRAGASQSAVARQMGKTRPQVRYLARQFGLAAARDEYLAAARLGEQPELPTFPAHLYRVAN